MSEGEKRERPCGSVGGPMNLSSDVRGGALIVCEGVGQRGAVCEHCEQYGAVRVSG